MRKFSFGIALIVLVVQTFYAYALSGWDQSFGSYVLKFCFLAGIYALVMMIKDFRAMKKYFFIWAILPIAILICSIPIIILTV